MAKRKTNIEELEEVESKSYSKWQIFLFLILIPLLFIVTVIYVVLPMVGFDVNEKINSLPFVSSNEEEMQAENQKRSNEEIQKQVESLQEKIKSKDDEISNYESQLVTKDKKIDELNIEIRNLEEQMDDLDKKQNEQKLEQKEIISTYENMAPKRAALIFAELKEDQAMVLLKQLKANTRTAILEKMEPAVAARYTTLLTEQLEQ
ncbi:hypothetical protein FZC66_03770 [Priestia megaterium]|nr:hypothetical protein FZC66_03770 [Priestia megaterium]